MADESGEGRSESSNGMRIDPALVRELAELLTANELTEIEVEDGDRKIKVSRNLAPVAAAAPMMQAAVAPSPAPSPAATAAAPVDNEADEDLGGQTVKSPMVGTAFLAPDPNSRPFVSVGDAVKAGDTLLIIEAMKVMNPITAPAGGLVKKILVSNAQPVEFDQPLVVIG